MLPILNVMPLAIMCSNVPDAGPRPPYGLKQVYHCQKLVQNIPRSLSHQICEHVERTGDPVTMHAQGHGNNNDAGLSHHEYE